MAPKSLTWMRERVKSVVAHMECERTFTVHDDMYFWDRAVGAACEHADGSVGSVMVYRHGGSVAAVLQDWKGAISKDEPALVSDHVLVMTNRAEMESIADAVPGLGETMTQVPPAPSLTAEQQAIGMCIGFVASNLAAYAAGDPEPASDVAELDSTYPGYEQWVSQLHESSQMENLMGLQEEDPAAFEPALSRFGPEAKENCAAAVGD